MPLIIALLLQGVTRGVGTAHPSRESEFTLIFRAVRDCQTLVFCVVFCRLLFVLFFFFLLAIVLAVLLRFMASNYHLLSSNFSQLLIRNMID
jgi:hypothetical protein